MVTVNGKESPVAEKTVNEALDFLGYSPVRVAVEINGELVARDKRATTVIRDGDQVEIVSFVGGG